MKGLEGSVLSRYPLWLHGLQAALAPILQVFQVVVLRGAGDGHGFTAFPSVLGIPWCRGHGTGLLKECRPGFCRGVCR